MPNTNKATQPPINYYYLSGLSLKIADGERKSKESRRGQGGLAYS